MHADTWNIPGGDLEDCIGQSTLLDRFEHIVLGLPAPYPEHVARWITSRLINEWT